MEDEARQEALFLLSRLGLVGEEHRLAIAELSLVRFARLVLENM